MASCTGIECFIIALREAGFTLVLLWLLTLAIVYGMLSHAKLPKSDTMKGLISISSAFLVLLAAAASPAVAFLQNLIVSSIMIAFGLMVLMIFLEITGTKHEGDSIFSKHSKWFGAGIVVIMILIFVGAGGLGIINIPDIGFDESMTAVLLFVGVMLVSIWVIIKEGSKPKK